MVFAKQPHPGIAIAVRALRGKHAPEGTWRVEHVHGGLPETWVEVARFHTEDDATAALDHLVESGSDSTLLRIRHAD